MRWRTAHNNHARAMERATRPDRLPLWAWRTVRQYGRHGRFEDAFNWGARRFLKPDCYGDDRPSIMEEGTDLTRHEYGVLLSTHQNGFISMIPSEAVPVGRLVEMGLLYMRGPVTACLTEEARAWLDGKRQ